MLCFFHKGDLDGHCAGAIVRRKFVNADMIGIDYEDPFPWDIVDRGQAIVMVDFSLPMDDMALLKKLASPLEFIWIDHHQTAIDKAKEAGFDCPGLRRVGEAACELAWQFFFPYAVWLLGRYDVYDESQKVWQLEILPFQYGLRSFNTFPDDPDTKPLWHKLLDKNARLTPDGGALPIIPFGEAILNYEEMQNAKLMAQYGFGGTFEKLPALFINNGPGGSKKFEGRTGYQDYPLLISFARIPGQRWRVNLYTFQEGIHCGNIARKYGGGGHQKAAGFVCDRLPFEI